MAASKAVLKAIKTAIDAGEFSSAREKASELVKQDAKNYTALIFLGFAQDKLENEQAAEQAYEAATKLKPTDPQALKGLINLYEKQGQKCLDQYHSTVTALAEIYGSLDDRSSCQTVVDKYEAFAKKHASRSQYRKALELHLPSCSLYPYLEGRIPHPSYTLQRIIESMEAEEKEWINGQIGERRTRLGAKIDQVTSSVKREAFVRYPLETLYQEMINWNNDDDSRRNYEEKLLQRAYETLLAFPESEKAEKRNQVLTLANGMVIVKHAYSLAWTIALEWVDAESLADWDVNIFRDYVDLFPESGFSKVIRAFVESDISPFPKPPEKTPTSESESENEGRISEADRLITMVEGLEDSQASPLAHRVMAETYLAMGEHGYAVESAQRAKELYTKTARSCGVDLQNSLDSVNMTLADAYIVYQAPRYHQEAKQLFENVLTRKPTASRPLSGIGLILEEDEDYGEAVSFLDRALKRDPDNIKIRAELAWCRALSKDMLMTGLDELEDALNLINEQSPANLSLKAETLYRIGFCQWKLNSSSYPQGDKSGPYRFFLDSIKADASFAPAYTMLGTFFERYGKSKRRARTAYQKAFELSSSEIEAAHRLAGMFADAREWDLVELVALRVESSGRAVPAPGSKKKAQSWPFAALGVVEMNRQQYSKSIAHFQRALRIAPDKYHCWVGLGESYHNSGRYIAAERAFRQAESLAPSVSEEEWWLTKYMLANVQRETGAYDEAIQGYEAVLDFRPDEFGVALALLQTLIESAWANLEAGRFGEASDRADRALDTAARTARPCSDAFNLWKAVADACSILAAAPVHVQRKDIEPVKQLLAESTMVEQLEGLDDLDGISLSVLQELSEDRSPGEHLSKVDLYLICGILASKRAILVASKETDARAVSWYNLGWLEYRVSRSAKPGDASRQRSSMKAAMQCFKRAIELEASNSEFWNAFAITAMQLHPALSQHAFVRSLHLNDKSARTWTNLGGFYMIHNDHQLANEAFTHAQSADPDYAYAWLGQGLLATLVGDAREARGLFTHAFDISNSSSVITQQQYSLSVFDHIASGPTKAAGLENLVRPLFALHQLLSQAPGDVVFTHLSALYAERVESFDESEEHLEKVCTAVEEEYEKTESADALSRYSQAKSDLARVQLARSEYQRAAENAEIALDLSSEDASGVTDVQARHRWRLSARLTAALAHHFLGEMDKSIGMFQKALEEAKGEPDVVCMLAQVLWAKGGSDERNVAREQLFDCVEKHPEHVGAVTLLGVIALLDGDEDAVEAVEGDLQAMRLSDQVDVHNKARVTRVLAGISAIGLETGHDAQEAAIFEATKSIMLSPGQPAGWSELAALSEDSLVADMATVNAMRSVPPRGELDASELSKAYSQTGRRKDALQSILVAPWMADGWTSLADSLST